MNHLLNGKHTYVILWWVMALEICNWRKYRLHGSCYLAMVCIFFFLFLFLFCWVIAAIEPPNLRVTRDPGATRLQGPVGDMMCTCACMYLMFLSNSSSFINLWVSSTWTSFVSHIKFFIFIISVSAAKRAQHFKHQAHSKYCES